MRQLYRTFIEDDGSDDGNTVRAIPAGIGRIMIDVWIIIVHFS